MPILVSPGLERVYQLNPVISKDDVDDNNRLFAATITKSPLAGYEKGYNNFPNESTALNFIAGEGRQLFAVIPEIRNITDAYYSSERRNVFTVTKYLFTRTAN